MIKRIVLSVITVMMVFGVSAQKIKGSDTVLPLAQQEAENFMKVNKNAKLTVSGGGSGVGIAALIENNTDIAMSSRKIKLEERMKIQKEGDKLIEKIIAMDALAIVVNPANKVSKLTREQMEGIFTGKITNWKEVGGDDMKIIVYARESSSGTYEFLKESIMKNKNYTESALSMPATGAVIQSVSQTKGAIGYVGLAYLTKNIKPLSVSYDGIKFTSPSYENAKNGSYPIVRPLFFYYNQKNESKVKPFIDYVTSLEGQLIVKKVGYIDILK